MLNYTGVKKATYGAPSQILFNVQNQMSVGVVVSNAAYVTEDGRKIVKAGTPLAGDLKARNTPFTKATDDSVVGVLLHDVDVTDGNGNGSLLIWGFVNLDRLDDTTAGYIDSTIEDALAGRVYFLKDN